MPQPRTPQSRVSHQPNLMTTPTADEDSNATPTSPYGTHPKDEVDPKTLAYLLRYETMVRQQEAEDMATLAHLRPLLERIHQLGSDGSSAPPSRDAVLMEREVSYKVLERALDALESSSEPMTTDKQLMMVLRTLTGKIPSGEESITWAEFAHCYKTVIAGMQTLQHLPSSSSVRTRARDRTLSILSLFEPPSTKLLANRGSSTTIEANDPSIDKLRAMGVLPARKVGLVKFSLLLLPLISYLLFGGFIGDLFKRNEPVQNPRRLHRSRYSSRFATTSRSDSKPLDTFYRRAMPTDASSKRSTDRLNDPSKSLFEEVVAKRSTEKKLSRRAVKQQMLNSAFIGGGTGIIVAPIFWNVIQRVAPKALVSMMSIPGPTAAVALSAAAVGSLTFGSLGAFHALKKGVRGFFTLLILGKGK